MAVPTCALFASLLAVVLASPAVAVTIDNFEEGAITLLDDSTTLGATFEEQSGLDTANVAGGVRLVTATASGTLEVPGTASATLAPLPLVDDSVLLTASLSGVFSFFYDGIADGVPQTTDGGLGLVLDGNRFRVDLPAVTGTDAELRVTLWDSDSISNSLFHDAVTGSVDILFSEFSGIDFSDIQTIRLSVVEVLNGASLTITNFATIPEPGTGLLLATGLLGLAARRRVSR